MVHFLTLYNDPFNAIKNGKKSVEMRLNDERRQNISVGDILVFENIITKEKISVEVLEKNIYKNFFDLYGNYPKTEIGYDVNEIANPNDMLKYYSQEKILAVNKRASSRERTVPDNFSDNLLDRAL